MVKQHVVEAGRDLPVASRRQMLAALAAFPLAACGGGGGDGGGAPEAGSAPPTRLELTGSATQANAGDAAVLLHATWEGGTTLPTWKLVGPGTLSVIQGADVAYLPPATLDGPQTVSIEVSLGSVLSRAWPIQLFPADPLPVDAFVARTATPYWHHVAFGNGAFVALDGVRRGAWRSTDGLTWSRVADHAGAPGECVWGDAGWVGVTNQGDTFTSPDGIAWTRHPAVLPLPGAGAKVAAGNGLYVVFGGATTQVSRDGAVWQSVARAFTYVTFGNGRFMALSPTFTPSYRLVPYTSADAVDWQPTTDPGGLQSLVFRETDFLGGKDDRRVAVTADGATWVTFEPGGAHEGSGAIGSTGPMVFERRTDTLGVSVRGGPMQTVPFKVVARPESVAFGHGRYVGVSRWGWAHTSTDGINWAVTREGSVGDLTAVIQFKGAWLALSDMGLGLRSTDDGVTWQRISVSAPWSWQRPGLFEPREMAHDGKVVVAVGTDSFFYGAHKGQWMRSTDGVTWAPCATAATAAPVLAVVHDGTRFVCVDRSGAVHGSADGDQWSLLSTLPPSPASDGFPPAGQLAHGNGTYVAVGGYGYRVTSTDAVTWTVVPPAGQSESVSRGPTHWRSVAYDGTRFVALGDDEAATSKDGVTWTQAVSAIGGALVVSGGRFVVMRDDWVVSSADGLNWDRRRLPVRAHGLRAIAAAGERIVVVGNGSEIVVAAWRTQPSR